MGRKYLRHSRTWILCNIECSDRLFVADCWDSFESLKIVVWIKTFSSEMVVPKENRANQNLKEISENIEEIIFINLLKSLKIFFGKNYAFTFLVLLIQFMKTKHFPRRKIIYNFFIFAISLNLKWLFINILYKQFIRCEKLYTQKSQIHHQTRKKRRK